MTETVWYSAPHDEILLRTKRDRVARGCQALIEYEPGKFVPDCCELFEFKIDLKKWKCMVEQGLLVSLGKL